MALFLFNHYSHATYVYHCESMYSPAPVRSPCGGLTLQAPFAFRGAQAYISVERIKEMMKEKKQCVDVKRNRQRRSASPPLPIFRNR